MDKVLDIVEIQAGPNGSSFTVLIKKSILDGYNSSELKDGQFTLTLMYPINLNKLILDKLSVWGSSSETACGDFVKWEFPIEMREAISCLIDKLFKK